MSIPHRLANQMHTKAQNTLDQTHLKLRHKHSAVIFEKGHTSVQAYGRNHISCFLPRSNERKQQTSTRRKGRRQKERDTHDSRRTSLYRQLPIKGWHRKYHFKNLHNSNSGTPSNRRIASI